MRCAKRSLLPTKGGRRPMRPYWTMTSNPVAAVVHRSHSMHSAHSRSPLVNARSSSPRLTRVSPSSANSSVKIPTWPFSSRRHYSTRCRSRTYQKSKVLRCISSGPISPRISSTRGTRVPSIRRSWTRMLRYLHQFTWRRSSSSSRSMCSKVSTLRSRTSRTLYPRRFDTRCSISS